MHADTDRLLLRSGAARRKEGLTTGAFFPEMIRQTGKGTHLYYSLLQRRGRNKSKAPSPLVAPFPLPPLLEHLLLVDGQTHSALPPPPDGLLGCRRSSAFAYFSGRLPKQLPFFVDRLDSIRLRLRSLLSSPPFVLLLRSFLREGRFLPRPSFSALRLLSSAFFCHAAFSKASLKAASGAGGKRRKKGKQHHARGERAWKRSRHAIWRTGG